MIVYITHLTHECGVLGCTGRRAEVSSKSPQLVDRLRHLVPAMSLSAASTGGQAATIGWESSEPVAPLACLPASARGYLAYSPRQRSPVEHGHPPHVARRHCTRQESIHSSPRATSTSIRAKTSPTACVADRESLP